MTRPLGKTQEQVLRALIEHKSWHAGANGCGWVWDTRSGTEKVMQSLVKRGMVTQDEDGNYWPTEAARAEYLLAKARRQAEKQGLTPSE